MADGTKRGFSMWVEKLMTAAVPSSRKQVWLARGVIILAVLLFLILKASKVDISRAEINGATLYTPPLLLPIISAVLGIMVGAVAVVFWMQGRIYRVLARVMAVLSAYVLFNAPTGLNHRLIITTNSFDLRVGSWFSPLDTKVKFASLAYMSVDVSKSGGYELRALTKSGEEISVPMCDLVKQALPDVLREAARHNVVIGESADGVQIPAALRR